MPTSVVLDRDPFSLEGQVHAGHESPLVEYFDLRNRVQASQGELDAQHRFRNRFGPFVEVLQTLTRPYDSVISSPDEEAGDLVDADRTRV